MPITTIRPAAPDTRVDPDWSLTGNTSYAAAWSDNDNASYGTYPASTGMHRKVRTELPAHGIPAGNRIKKARNRTRVLRTNANDPDQERGNQISPGLRIYDAAGNFVTHTTKSIWYYNYGVVEEISSGWFTPSTEVDLDLWTNSYTEMQIGPTSTSYEYRADVRVYEIWLDLEHHPAPTLNLSGPSGSVGTTAPTVGWNYVHSEFPQLQYEVEVYYGSELVWSSGIVQGDDDSQQINEDLVDGRTYEARVRVAADWGAPYDPLWSNWESTSFTIDATPAALPDISVDLINSSVLVSLGDNSTDPAAEEFRIEKKAETEEEWHTVRGAAAIQVGDTLQSLDVELRPQEYTEYRARAVRYVGNDIIVSQPTDVRRVYNEQHKWLLKDILGEMAIDSGLVFDRPGDAYLDGEIYGPDVPRFRDSSYIEDPLFQKNTHPVGTAQETANIPFSGWATAHHDDYVSKVIMSTIWPGMLSLEQEVQGPSNLVSSRTWFLRRFPDATTVTIQNLLKVNFNGEVRFMLRDDDGGITYHNSDPITVSPGLNHVALQHTVPVDRKLSSVYVRVTRIGGSLQPGDRIEHQAVQVDPVDYIVPLRHSGPDGIIVEEGTTNVLDADVSRTDSGSDNGSANADTIIVYVNDGSYGDETARANDASSEIDIRIREDHSVSPDTTYTLSVYARSGGVREHELGIRVRIQLDGVIVVNEFYPTEYIDETYRRYEATFTIPSGSVIDSAHFYAYMYGGDADSYLYVDAWQLEEKPYATEWVLGGSSRNSESLYVDHDISIEEATVEFTATMHNDPALGNNPRIMNIGRGDNREINLVGADAVRWSFQVNDSTPGAGAGHTYSFNVPRFGNPVRCAIRWFGNTVEVFVNGTKELTLSKDFWPSAVDRIWLGSLLGNTRWGNITFHELRVSNRARTENELSTTYEPLMYDGSTTYLSNFNGNIYAQSVNPDAELEIDVEQDTLDQESTEAISRFQPLGAPDQRKTYPIVVKDAVHSEQFSVTLGFIGRENYERFKAIREAQRVFLLTAPMREGFWYAVFDSPMRDKLINMNDPMYRQVTAGIIEVDKP